MNFSDHEFDDYLLPIEDDMDELSMFDDSIALDGEADVVEEWKA